MFAFERDVLLSAQAPGGAHPPTWGSWELSCVRITPAGVLSHVTPHQAARDPVGSNCPTSKKFQLNSVSMLVLTHAEGEEVGVLLKCQTVDRGDALLRLILAVSQLEELSSVIKSVAKQHNIDHVVRQEVKAPHVSPMRQVVTIVDPHDKRTKQELIIAKRGAFKWMPVQMGNDLIHGAWWFFWGCAGLVVTCVVVIANKELSFLQDDDSILSDDDFLASWVLLLFSAVVSTVGSLVFVRAFQEDPPMPPLFTWYHVQNDELLASWLYFSSAVPSIPYLLLFANATHFTDFVYLTGLFFAALASFCAWLFVRACYPAADDAAEEGGGLFFITGYTCLSMETRQFYFLNDWLGGTWICVWCSVGLTVVAVVALIYEAYLEDSLQIFIVGTSVVESTALLIGSMYFVAGSYPAPSAEAQTRAQQTVGNRSVSLADPESLRVSPRVSERKVVPLAAPSVAPAHHLAASTEIRGFMDEDVWKAAMASLAQQPSMR